MDKFTKYAVELAWIISIIATMISLSFSLIFKFIPCDLCWYQRILMYPLVVILAVGIYTKDKNVKFYVLPLSIFGILVSGYHVLVQNIDILEDHTFCNIGASCSTDYINLLGFITIPLMALVSFILITALVWLDIRAVNVVEETTTM
ncbi:disulfide oxidoreductase [Metabacillus sp. SLBN-84]